MDSFTEVYPERIGYERFHRHSVFGVPFFQKKTHESFPYDQEFMAIFDKSLESASPVRRPADYTRTLLGSIDKDYGYGWLYREKREILEVIYLDYRESRDLETAKQKVETLEAVLPEESEDLKDDFLEKLDALRLSVGLKPHMTKSESDPHP